MLARPVTSLVEILAQSVEAGLCSRRHHMVACLASTKTAQRKRGRVCCPDVLMTASRATGEFGARAATHAVVVCVRAHALLSVMGTVLSTLMLLALHLEKASIALNSRVPSIVWQRFGGHGLRAIGAVAVAHVRAVETFCGLLNMVALYALRLQRLKSATQRRAFQIVRSRHGEGGVSVT